MNAAATSKTPGLIRCAIYTRKSSEEGLEQDFNSLDTRRVSAELYVSSQRSEGWVCLPDRYDDGGYTGGNMERPGLRRGRRSAEDLRLGDALDFWRVTAIQPPRHLELTAEMILPGVATLTFDVEPADAHPDETRLVMTARFRPRGLLGIAYWYSVLRLHGIVFRGMHKGLVQTAEQGPSRSL